MKISYSLLLVVLLAPDVLYRVAADSEVVDARSDTKTSALSKNNGDDRVTMTVDPAKEGKDVNLNANDSSKQLESKGGENEQKKVNDSAVKDEQEQKQKQNKGSDSESSKRSKEGNFPIVREKCDSSSNSCMDDTKTLVACLRVPGNESPELSLLIQNKGKGPLSVTISASELVQLEKKQIQLQEKEDTEVSISGVESGQFIILTAGHGNCRLDFRDQYVHGKKKGDGNSESMLFNLFQHTSLVGFLFLAALAVVVSILMCVFWKRHFERKGPKYQKLDMELPVSHGSKLEPGMNEGWDDSWGDSWDDEEAPKSPSFPVTPSLSSKGMASRKFNKVGKVSFK